MGHSFKSLAWQTSTRSGEMTFFPPLKHHLDGFSHVVHSLPHCPVLSSAHLHAHSPIVTSAVNVRCLTMVPICSICIRHFSSKRLEWSWKRVHFIQPQLKKCQVPIREGLLPFSRTPPLQSHSLFTPQPTLSHSGLANGTWKQRPPLPQLPQRNERNYLRKD